MPGARSDLLIRGAACAALLAAWSVCGAAFAQPDLAPPANQYPAASYQPPTQYGPAGQYPPAQYPQPQYPPSSGYPQPGQFPAANQFPVSPTAGVDPQAAGQYPPAGTLPPPASAPAGPPPGYAPPPGNFVPAASGPLVGTPIAPQPVVPRVTPRPGELIVVKVLISGVTQINRKKIPRLKTREGEIYDPQIVEDDVKAMMKSKLFVDVNPKTQTVPGGIIVIFQVFERPTIQSIIFVGNEGVLSSTLLKTSELEVSQGMDPYAIKEARDKIEVYYKEHGWDRPRVTVFEGDKPGDHNVVFLIDEGRTEKIWYTRFIGNTFVSGARLRTQIDTSRPILYLFKGDADRKKVDEDCEKLTAYYRGFGYFQAKVGRYLEEDVKQKWLTVTFVINEGPRYQVRNVMFNGNQRMGEDALAKDLKLHGNQPFNQGAMTRDLGTIRDLYGGQGYVFADIQADPRFLDEPAKLDLIYNIKRRSRYRVGQDHRQHSRRRHAHARPRGARSAVVAARRHSRLHAQACVVRRCIRLKASQVFATDPTKAPKITFSPLKGSEDGEKEIADKPDDRRHGSRSGSGDSNVYRGQSPDDDWVDVDLTIDATLADEPTAGATISNGGGTPDQGALTPALSHKGRGSDASPGPAALGDGASTTFDRKSPTTFDRQAWFRNRAAAGLANAPIIRCQAPFGGQPVQPAGPDSSAQIPYTPQQVNIQPQPAAGYQSYPAQPAPVTYPSNQPYNGAAPGQVLYGANGQPINQQPGAPATYPPNGAPAAAPVQPTYTWNQPGRYQSNYYQVPGAGVAPGQVPPGGPIQVFNDGPAPYAVVEPWLPVDVFTNETQTGKLMVGVGVNSDAGLIGNITVDEQNFDITRWPNSWEDFRDGTAFRGAGERFRIEAAPGTEVQRYVISFGEPYLFDTPVSFTTSASYFTRIYNNWDEDRVGGRIGLGYYFTPDLSGSVGLKAENIRISNPTVPTPAALEEVLGHNEAYGFNVGVAHDTRDNAFMPTQGHLWRLGYEQTYGSFEYPQFTVEARQYFKLAERPDGSGRQVLGIGNLTGFAGSDTPIYDRYFGGGFSTLRGFVFRGASPLDEGVQVGGDFEFFNTIEYNFPITADDVLRMVTFVDFGTVEPSAEIKWDDFRIAPGVGLRIAIPMLGPAPIALDFAVPVHHMHGDQEEIFSFFVGLAR